MTSFRPTENWREGEEPATDLVSFIKSAKSIFWQKIIHLTIFSEGGKSSTNLASFTRSAKSFFFQEIIHFTIFKYHFEHVWPKIMSQEQPWPRVVVKMLVARPVAMENVSDRITSWKRDLAGKYCSKCSTWDLKIRLLKHWGREALGHVRYLNILTRPRGFQGKLL